MGTLLAGVWRKAEEDDIFFLAGAISFNILVAFLPLVVAVIGIAGTIVNIVGGNVNDVIVRYITRSIPGAVDVDVTGMIATIREQSGTLLSIGGIFLVWISTRLISTLRTVLREIFDLHRGRGIIRGKLFDVQMVFMAGTLFALNIGITIAVEVVARVGSATFGLSGLRLPWAMPWARVAAFFTLWVMFLVIYRYLPPRRIRWRTGLVAATFTAVLFEVLKLAFSWYVTRIANYSSTYGNIATFLVLVFWIYYSSIVFVLGGEVAQVGAMQAVRKHQRERLE
ncbi:MAG TPA: YihY/virulence factor BrkB family protein [Longimicrobiales bacterium]|nr:YihY/virulence factor BrkB family protein [Longimicrobiales bacterium]